MAGRSICGEDMAGSAGRINLDEAIADIREDIGALSGRLGSLEGAIPRIDDSLRKLLENNNLVVEIHRMVIAHDKRIGTIENRCYQRESEMRTFSEHIKNDRPVDAIAGEWALRVVIFIAGAGGWWLLSRMPRIWELLR